MSSTALFVLNGADNVTIDGRPLSTGSSRLLRFSNLSNTNSSHTILFQNDATSNTITYTTLTNARNNTNIVRTTVASVILFGNASSSTSNSNNSFTYNVLTGGNTGINFNGTTLTNPSDFILIKGNQFNSQLVSSVRLDTMVRNVTIDSNQFSHPTAVASSGFQAINISHIHPLGTVTITRNRVFNINFSTANIAQGIVFSPLTASGSLIVRNNSVIIGSATLPNTLTQIIRGFLFGGTQSATVIVEHNTFRIGGTHVTPNLNPTSMGLLKSNSSTSSSFSCKNNIIINTRTGTTNQHVAAFYNTPNSGTNVIDYNTYMNSGAFINLWVGNFYGTVTAYKSATLTQEQNSSFGTIDFVNTTEAIINIAGPNNTPAKLIGAPLGVLTDMYGNTRSAARPYKGAYEAPTPITDTFDLQSVIVYTFGKIPIGTDDTVRVLVRNNGAVPVTNIPIHLHSKLNGYLGSVNASINVGSEEIIKLVPYTPSTIGFDTLTVNSDPDQKPSNDTAIWVRENTLNALSFSRPFVPQSGNLGTNPEGEIVAKFYTPVANFVNQVNVNFTTNGTFSSLPFQVVIYEDSGATAGPKRNPLWVSSVQNTINGIFNLPIPSIQVSGSFYIGVRQTTPNNIGFAFQNENPIRNNTFYFRQGAAYLTSVWNDFSVNASNQFRFMIEPRLTINDDLGVASLVAPGAGCVNLGTQPVTFQVQNLGLLSQNFSTDTLKLFGRITKPSGNVISFGPINVTNGFLTSGNYIDVFAIPSFNFDSAGAYTFTAWTKFGPDANAINDTLPPFVRTVLATTNAPVIENFNAATFPTKWTTNRFAISNGNGTNGSNSIRVNIFNTTPFTANSFIQSPRIGGIQLTSVLRFDYRILNFTGNTAATLINTDSIKIMVSTDCGNTFTNVALINGANHSPSASFKQYSVPLAAFVGNDVIIKIVYDWFGTTNDVNIDMDNIRIVDGANDVGVSSVTAPCRSIISGSSSFFPAIRVLNSGSQDQYNIPVNISITGPVSYSSSGLVSIAVAGTTTSFLFPAAFNPTTTGTYTVKTWTGLSNDGDPTNDTTTYTFDVTNVAATANAANAIQFNTTSSMLVQDNASLHFSNQLSVEAWVSRNTSATNRTIIAKDSTTFGFIDYSLALNSANMLEFTMNTTGGFHFLVSKIAVPTGFNHVAATFNGTEFRFYINGTIALDTVLPASSIIPNNYNLIIGNSAAGTTGFSGVIDELKLWNIALTADQIRASMHTRLGIASSINLIGYYHFDEGAGKSFSTDISGNCNTAIFGATAPIWITASYPLGNPVVANQTVFVDGSYPFGTTDLNINYTGSVGTDTVYVHKFAGPILGTTPITNPGGITNVEPNNWILYRYGNLTSVSTDLTFQLGTGHLNSTVTANDIKLFNRTANSTGAWNMANTNATTASFATQTVSFAQTQGIFGNQLTIGANNNPLPVVMLYLNGRSSKLDALVQWATASERYCKGFAIERSFDGKRFEEIGFVNGSGNSNTSVKYSYVDRGVFNGKTTAFYRLKQVDVDGGFTQSEVVVIKQSDVSAEGVTVYPNPVKTELNIEIEALKTSKGMLIITDISGKVIVEQPLTIGEGFNKYTLPEVNSLKNGIYFVTITENNKNIFNGKVVKSE